MANPLSQYNTEDLFVEQAASRGGFLFRAFIEDTIPDGATRDYVIDIPVGVDVFGFFRGQEIDGNTCTSQFLTCTSFTGATPEMQGLNFDRTEDYPLTAQSVVKRASAVSGVLAHTGASTQYVASGGPVRAPSNQTVAGAQPRFRNGKEYPLFRYVNTGGADASLILTLFWQELPNGL